MIFDLDIALEHSYKDFHAKGLDYICLKRTPERTVKVYFFDGDLTKLPEVVNPHDHRYAFETTVLAGGLTDYRYTETTEDQGWAYEAHDYMTPLNGGNGFTWSNTVYLKPSVIHISGPGEVLRTEPYHIHTIAPFKDQTVLLLIQEEDQVPLDAPTKTFVRDTFAPSLDGLYSRFKPDELLSRFRIIDQLLTDRKLKP